MLARKNISSTHWHSAHGTKSLKIGVNDRGQRLISRHGYTFLLSNAGSGVINSNAGGGASIDKRLRVVHVACGGCSLVYGSHNGHGAVVACTSFHSMRDGFLAERARIVPGLATTHEPAMLGK